MIFITSDRIRALVSDCKTENDIIRTLRTHKVKHSISNDTGYKSILIPCRKGYIRIYRTISRKNPFVIRSVPAVPYILPAVPVYYNMEV